MDDTIKESDRLSSDSSEYEPHEAVRSEILLEEGSSQSSLDQTREDSESDLTIKSFLTRPTTETIFGEVFEIKSTSGNVIISHHEWSLVGMGRNKIEAKEDLYQEIKELSEIYLEESPLQMSKGALKMRGFLYKVNKYANLFETRNPILSGK